MKHPNPATVDRLRSLVRDVPDFPKKGILFRDITPLLADAAALKGAIEELSAPFEEARVSRVVGIESRGFILGSLVAYRLGAGFVPVRKAGKLPSLRIGESYALEYGEDRLEMHRDGVHPGEKVLVVDDLLATGGTAGATVALSRRLGAEVIACAFLIELTPLGGRSRLAGVDVLSLIRY